MQYAGNIKLACYLISLALKASKVRHQMTFGAFVPVKRISTSAKNQKQAF